MMQSGPTGSDVLNPLWPDARWNISSFCVHDHYIYTLCVLLKDRYGIIPNIDSVHGSPPVLWNNGRLMETKYSDEQIRATITMFNAIGVGVYFTFSNHLLTADDLKDETCNRLLSYIDNGSGLNGVILASEILHEYLRDNHPALKQTASVIKVAQAGRDNLDYYLDHIERFDSVMLHPDDAFNPTVLGQLDRDRMEIMVNENCPFMCQNRAKHYDAMPRLQKLWVEGTITKDQTSRCHSIGGGFHPRHRSCNLRSDELKAIYDTGFRRFKIQGRLDRVDTFAYDTMRFLLDRDLAMPLIYKSFLTGWANRQAAAIFPNSHAANGPHNA